MKPIPIVFCCALALGATTAWASPVQAQVAAKPAPTSSPPATAPDAVAPEVEPEARLALERMSAYLGTLKTFEIRTQTSLDVVTETGQRVQLDGTAHYKVRSPNGFVIEVATDLKKRTFFYDGKSFTIFSPEHEFFAAVSAPPTTLQLLDVLWDEFAIALPLEDLFRWTDLKSRRPEPLTGGFLVGPATLDGVLTDQYAFRQGEVDWSVWIDRGERPLPRKLMIIDRSQAEQPAYVARLTWTLNPTFAADTFTFRPGPKAKPIRMSTLDAGSTP